MGDRSDFMGRVLAELKHLTLEEREAVRQEIDGHMEDRIEDLVELGISPELAEERTLAAMGDPAEIGRELNKQYPPGWLWIGRAAFMLTLVLCIQAVLAFGMWGFVWDSLTARFFPPESAGLHAVTASEPLDIRIPVGNDILRITRVSVGRQNDQTEKLLAEVAFCTYDRIPGGVVSIGLRRGTVLENQRGEYRQSGGGGGHVLREYESRRVEIQPEDTYVILAYDYLGEQFRQEIPLPGMEGETP